jgi:hypothetical protein
MENLKTPSKFMDIYRKEGKIALRNQSRSSRIVIKEIHTDSLKKAYNSPPKTPIASTSRAPHMNTTCQTSQ